MYSSDGAMGIVKRRTDPSMEWCTFRLIIIRSDDFDIRFGIRNDVEEWYFDLKTGYSVDS